MKKILVTGGRHYANRDAVWAALDNHWGPSEPLLVIQGGSSGADYHARSWCEDRGHFFVEVPVEHMWPYLGKMAGPVRNEIMVGLLPDLVLAFPGGRGTANCVSTAKQAGIPVEEHD